MPGTIQVSVVEFKSSSSSPTSLKVSMGRRGYETWDNGDFSFPVTTLRENLVVALQDADGNEISRTGVGIMLIVEKGSWDDYFPLEGGGQVHLKLHFVLSEEDRDRVRLLRESALKKKQQKGSTESVESPLVGFEQKITGMFNGIMRITPSQDTEMSVCQTVVSVEDEAVDTSSLLCPGSVYFPQFSTVNEEQKSSAQLRIIDSSERKEDPLGTEVERESVVVHETIGQHAEVGLRPSSDQETSSKLGLLGSEFKFEKKGSISPKPNDDSLHKSEVQAPIKKSPSAVWKMISAFETNLSQDPRSSVKSPNLKSPIDQVGKRGYKKDTNSKDVTTPAESNSDFLPSSFLERKETSSFVSGKSANISSNNQAGEKLTAQNDKSTDFEMEDVGSSRILNESFKEEDIDINRVVGETSEVSNSKEPIKLHLNLTRNSERTFSGRTHEENNSSENLVMEAFPNNARRLCITTAGKEVMSLFEKHEPEERNVPESENPASNGEGVMSQGDQPKKKDYRGFGMQRRNSRSDGSPDAPGGLVGQAIKVAVIVGFGVLVLLTRQREPRKGKTQANNRFKDLSGFIYEDHTL